METAYFVALVIIFILFIHYNKCKNDMKMHMEKVSNERKEMEKLKSGSSLDVAVSNAATTSGFAPSFSPETMVINSSGSLEDNSWSSAIQDLALEKGVAESHNKFVKDRGHVSSGASSQSIASHENDVNTRVGLRKIDYRVKVGADARTVPTDDLNDPNTLLPNPTKLNWR
jgi:hypothetical protein